MKSIVSFHHIGYAVQDIEITAKMYIEAGWVLSEVYIETIQNSKIAFLSRDKFPLIELVAPIDDTSPIVQTINKSGVTPYHICYEVDDIEEAVEDFWEAGHFIPLFEPVASNAMEDRKICYLYNKDIGLIELVEMKKCPNEKTN